MKKFTPSRLLSGLALGFLALQFPLGAAAQNLGNIDSSVLLKADGLMYGQTFMSTKEKFAVCKNLRSNIVYRVRDAQVVLSSAMDGNNIRNPNTLSEKRAAWLDSLKSAGVKNADQVEGEFYSAVNFYLTKNNTLDLERLNKFLNFGSISDVALTCTDSNYAMPSEYLDNNESEIRQEVLFAQKVKI